jgi:twitching motility two-component system response regulator PilH
MPKTVLVVEDFPAHRKLMESALEGHGYQILIAEDGEQALEQVRRHQPDVVLLDVVLPKKNGYQVCRQIKSAENTRRIRVVMISSKTQDADRYWGLKQGADAYITKPFAPEQLRAAIEQTV